MATYQKFDSFIEEVFEAGHNMAADTFSLALTSAAPIASNAVLADLSPISYTFCSSRILTVSSSSQTSGTYKWIVSDKTLSASGGAVGPFQYASIVNDTSAGDKLVAFYNYGTALTLNDGESLLFDFDGTNGVFSAT